MPNQEQYHDRQAQVAALFIKLAKELAPDVAARPEMLETLYQRAQEVAAGAAEDGPVRPADLGLADLIGLGKDAADNFGSVRVAPRVAEYDDLVAPERISAVADLYYIYQHERLGIFRVVLKLQELFKAGTVRLSSGAGAFALYRFDRRQVLRYNQLDRFQAYRRVFGYTNAPPPPGSTANSQFHSRFSLFNSKVASYWRDKRISDVIRPRATDPSFGSMAVVKRAGLDLRDNLNHASHGHVNVLRIDALQLLEEAFRIVEAPDVKRLFGADDGWDVIEEVLRRYFGQHVEASQRNRMAVAGRDILNWLGQRYLLVDGRTEFEAALYLIANRAEEWITSAQAVEMVERQAAQGAARAAGAPPTPPPTPARANGAAPARR